MALTAQLVKLAIRFEGVIGARFPKTW